MYKTLNILFQCNHLITNTEHFTEELEFVCQGSEESKFTDKNVSDIISILVNGRPVTAYRMKGKNTIEWLNDFNRPIVGDDVKIAFSHSLTKHIQFESEQCPRCNGKGWYVALFGRNFSTASATGASKLVQDYVKILLTGNVMSYGTRIKDIIGRVDEPNLIISDISEAIIDAEDQCKKFQLDAASTGAEIPDSEKLRKVEIAEISHIPEETSYYVDVILTNMSNEKTNIVLKL